nr:uncharacterized protein LOC129254333 [Lytechinus pictus]
MKNGSEIPCRISAAWRWGSLNVEEKYLLDMQILATRELELSYVGKEQVISYASGKQTGKVGKPTRQDNILDLIFTNNPSVVKSSSSIPGISDHAMAVTDFDILPSITKYHKRKFFLFKKADWNGIRDEMSKLSDEISRQVELDGNIDDIWTLFKTSLMKVVDKNIPSKMRSGRKSLPWFCHSLKRMVKRKARLYKKAEDPRRTSNKAEDWEKYKRFQRTCKKAFKKAEEEHVTSSIVQGLEENNPKPFWRYIASKRQDRTGLPPLKNAGNLIHESRVPSDWKKAHVTPVFKKGDVHSTGNYRPVSLTSVICKQLEHIICKHLFKHLQENNILSSLNHGFRSGHSTETQLLTTVHDLLLAHDKKVQSDVIILDFAKAFDTVPHSLLLHKPANYGIDGSIHKWLTSFLTHREMTVVVDGEHSDPEEVTSGVPQGTVLGPLLFLCHINDLPDVVQSQVRLFADDCVLYRQIKSQRDHHKLQQDLTALENWASTWGMRFNAGKCQVMSINAKTSYFYTINDCILKHVSQHPYLGVTLADNLKWSPQINKAVRKANSVLAYSEGT